MAVWQSTTFIVLLVLTALNIPIVARAGDHRSQARQSFRVHVSGEIHIAATNPDISGQPQALRISSGMDVSLRLENATGTPRVNSFVCTIREGQTNIIPITKSVDLSDRPSVLQITILPGW